MDERTGVVTSRGNPLTLLGVELKVGDTAPDVEVIANDMSPVSLSSFKGKVCILSAVMSLDTSVCATETRKFNESAEEFDGRLEILTISMDLPFAQKRWCGAAGLENARTLSDYRGAKFGHAYGILIKELYLLARAVFVVDKEGIVRYVQVVPEVTDEPDYNAVIEAARKLL